MAAWRVNDEADERAGSSMERNSRRGPARQFFEYLQGFHSNRSRNVIATERLRMRQRASSARRDSSRNRLRISRRSSSIISRALVHGGQARELSREEIAGDLPVQGLGDNAVQVFFQRNGAEQVASVLGGEKVLVERLGQAVRQGFPASGNDALPIPEQQAHRPAGPEKHPERDAVGPPTDQRADQGEHDPVGQGFGKSFLR